MKSEHARKWNAQVGRGFTNKPFTIYVQLLKLELLANEIIAWI